MKKALGGLLVGSALVAGLVVGLPTEVRFAYEQYLLPAEARMAQVDEEQLRIGARFAQVDDEQLRTEARFAEVIDYLPPEACSASGLRRVRSDGEGYRPSSLLPSTNARSSPRAGRPS